MSKLLICGIVGLVCAYIAFVLCTKMGIAATPALIMDKQFPVGLLVALVVGLLMAWATPKLCK